MEFELLKLLVILLSKFYTSINLNIYDKWQLLFNSYE